MTKNAFLASIGALLILSLGVSPGEAGRTSLYFDTTALTTFTPEDSSLGAYYMLTFSVPPEAARAKWAFIEFYMDVSARVSHEVSDQTPLLDVFALTQSDGYSGSLDPSQLEPLSLPMARHVAVGQDRRVVIDVTEIVRNRATAPRSNCTLLIGSLAGSRNGLFAIKTGRLDKSGIARVTFFD